MLRSPAARSSTDHPFELENDERSASAEPPTNEERHEADITAEQVFREMSAAQAEAAETAETTDFCIRPLGGRWTAAHLNIAFDAWQARAVTKGAKDWCKMYNLQVAQRWDLSLYAHAGALHCAQYWCQKLEAYYNRFQEAGGQPPFVDADEDLAFDEPAEFSAIVQTCAAPSAQRRFAQRRALRPEGGGSMPACG